jgi:hypothetical protein
MQLSNCNIYYTIWKTGNKLGSHRNHSGSTANQNYILIGTVLLGKEAEQ